MRTWIVVCDASRARFFMTREGTQEWVKFEEFEHPASRVKNMELGTDRHGRRTEMSGEGQSHGPMDHGLSPHQVELLRFAHAIGETLNSAYAQNAFDRLVIVAPPQFLGMVRGELNHQARKAVYATLDRDYTLLDEGELQERITLP